MKGTRAKHVRLIGVDDQEDAVPQPADRGRLYYDHEIPDAFLGGLPGIACKVRWIRAHLPRATRIKIGRASAWYEVDIRAYVASLQSRSAGEERIAV